MFDEEFNFANARRRSNSSGYSTHLSDFKTKFETLEPDPVFEEELHGASSEDMYDDDEEIAESSTSGASTEEDDRVARKA